MRNLLAGRRPSHLCTGEGEMNTRQGSAMQALRSANAFLEQHADVLASVVQTGSRKKLADVVASLEPLRVSQASDTLAALGATRRHYALRRTLLQQHMRPIARIAGTALQGTPELASFRMPRADLGAEKLAAAAFGMATAARVHASVFVDAGLNEGFADDLAAAASAMLRPVDVRAQSRSSQRGATTGLGTALRQGRKLVHILDALVQNAFQDDPALLAAWDSAKRSRVITARHDVVATAQTPDGTPAAQVPSPIAA